jgi:hypothetical protein
MILKRYAYRCGAMVMLLWIAKCVGVEVRLWSGQEMLGSDRASSDITIWGLVNDSSSDISSSIVHHIPHQWLQDYFYGLYVSPLASPGCL